MGMTLVCNTLGSDWEYLITFVFAMLCQIVCLVIGEFEIKCLYDIKPTGLENFTLFKAIKNPRDQIKLSATPRVLFGPSCFILPLKSYNSRNPGFYILYIYRIRERSPPLPRVIIFFCRIVGY